MLDVHPPTEPVHGWQQFFIHLTTITIGLLIALSLEGCVEWQHHRHLTHQAVVSLGNEIRFNEKEVPVALADVRRQMDVIQQNVAVLNRILADPTKPNREDIKYHHEIRWFNDASWRTAKTSLAMSYMPYNEALEYSDIYDQQDYIDAAEQQAIRDAVVAVGPLQNLKAGDANPTGETAAKIKENFEILQGQLGHVQSQIVELDREYKKFLATHPEE